MNQSELSMEQMAERIVPTQIGEKVLPEGVNLILRSETGTAPGRAITFIPNYSSPRNAWRRSVTTQVSR